MVLDKAMMGVVLLLGVLLLGAAGKLYYQGKTLDVLKERSEKQRAEIGRLTLELNLAQDEARNLEREIEAQNLAVAVLKAEAARLAKLAREAVDGIRKAAAAEAARIGQAPPGHEEMNRWLEELFP